jgi:hypothetical protein
VNEDHQFTDLLPKVQKRKSISIYLKLFETRFVCNCQDAFVLLLDFLDVGIFLDSFHIILLPFTKRLNPGALQLLKSQSLVVVDRVEACLRKFELTHIVVVLQSVRNKFSCLYMRVKPAT